MSKETISSQDIPQASPFLGKYLCHVRHADEGSGLGYAFCFGDSPDANSGPVAACKMEQHGKAVQLRMYFNGTWSDEEEVLYEAPPCGK